MFAAPKDLNAKDPLKPLEEISARIDSAAKDQNVLRH